MEKTTLVSIILPVYNGEKYIKQSIESCLNQTYKDIELIIVNDCSTDGTQNIINSYASKDSRVYIINNKENKKLPASLNIGHNAAKGEFISWTSDDNIYTLNAIEFLYKSLIDNKKHLAYCNVTVIHENGEVKREIQYEEKENLLFGNCIGSCFLYKKEVFKRNKGYDESLFLVEDYDFWLRASLHSSFYHLNKTLYKYRLHNNSLTNTIHINNEKKTLWKKNIETMYSNFSKSVMTKDFKVIAEFQGKILMHQKIEFNWLKSNFEVLSTFINKINEYSNYNNKSKVEEVFLKQIMKVITCSKNDSFKNSLFVIKNFFHVLDLTTCKKLIKYSFFKK